MDGLSEKFRYSKLDGEFKILLPLSWVYGFIMLIRNFMYDFGLLPIYRPEVPVISVGNITTGGTGKTPFVEFLLRYFLQRKIKTCVVSRGYKRNTKGTQLVSDGIRLYGDAASCGDEPFQIANKFREIIVIVDEKRKRGIMYALRQFSPKVIILDDGFQHRGVVRNLDILIVDSSKNLKEIPMLPAGQRREPLSGLKRADIIILNNVHQLPSEKLMNIFDGTLAPRVKMKYNAINVLSLKQAQSFPISTLKNKKCIAFCGIGNPNAFKTTLLEIGIQIVDFTVYPDHYVYSERDLLTIKDIFNLKKAEYIITTEKDAVRLQQTRIPDNFPAASCYYIDIEVNIIEGQDLLIDLLKQRIGL